MIFLYQDEKGNLTPCRSMGPDTVKEGKKGSGRIWKGEESHCVYSLVQSQISLKSNEELHFISNRDTIANNHYKPSFLIYSYVMVFSMLISQISNMLTQ